MERDRKGHSSQTDAKAARLARQAARLEGKTKGGQPQINNTFPSENTLVQPETDAVLVIPTSVEEEPVRTGNEVVIVEPPKTPVETPSVVLQPESAPKKSTSKAKPEAKPAVTPPSVEEVAVFTASELPTKAQGVGRQWLRWLQSRKPDDTTPPDQILETWQRVLRSTQDLTTLDRRWVLERTIEGMGHEKNRDNYGEKRDALYRSIRKVDPDYLDTLLDVPGIVDNVHGERLPSAAGSFIVAFGIMSGYTREERERLHSYIKSDAEATPNTSRHILDVIATYVAQAHVSEKKNPQ